MNRPADIDLWAWHDDMTAAPDVAFVDTGGDYGEAFRDATGAWWWLGAEDYDAAAQPIVPVRWMPQPWDDEIATEVTR